ncbi:MAG: GNAT family N-acetyltransferase [Planctomycetota bacterium]|nr:GNAT family N-acetyltransferase [Planctomycetota bacterium]
MSHHVTSLELRPFALGDAEIVAPWLSGPGLSLPPGNAPWPERLIDDQRIVALVACSAGEQIGLLRLDCGPDGVADVTLVVAPERRRQGVGRNMFGQALLRARAVGMRRLVAYIDLENDPACAFFESVGFEDCGVSGGRIRMERVVHTGGPGAKPLDVRG